MHYEVKINEFEGPLDLLLHLIKESNIDIYDISLSEITNQYLNYIKEMEKLDLDVASEYLVMASELIEYKSRSLLPKNEENEDAYEEDPKEELIKRLVDYKKYKEITATFKELEYNRGDIFTKYPSNINEYSEGIKNSEDISLDDLMDAFKKFMERKQYDKPLNTTVTTKELSVSDRMIEIRERLRVSKQINFIDLFDNYKKEYVIVTFLSILELSKNKELFIVQDNNFDNIIIKGCD